MFNSDRHYTDINAGLYTTGAIENGIRKGRRLRAEYVRNLVGKVRRGGSQAS